MSGTIFDRPSDHEIRKFIQGKFTVEFFPEGYILLNRELATGYHPALEILLSGLPTDEVDLRLSVIAHYLGIILDGAYTLEARSELCAIMSGRLEVIREYPLAQSIQPYSGGSVGPIGGTPINEAIDAAEKDFPTEQFAIAEISSDLQERINERFRFSDANSEQLSGGTVERSVPPDSIIDDSN